MAESAIASGVRRIEAVSGLEAYKQANEQLQLIKTVAGKLNAPVTELEKKIESLLAQQKELEKQLKAMQQKQAVETARGLVAIAPKVVISTMMLDTTEPNVPVTVDCAPITSLFIRLIKAPVCVRVKKAIGKRWTWSYSAVRNS